MTPEIDTYSASIRERLARVCGALDGLGERQLHWRPPFEDGNSAAVIAAHTLGNARAWVLGIICGRDVKRDRPGEFATSAGSPAELAERGRALCDEIAAALRDLPAARLDERSVPSQELWGEGPAREISGREAFLHVIEHASVHLGHLQLTRDLALAAG